MSTANGIVGVAVRVGGMTGVSEGSGVDVLDGSFAPQAFRRKISSKATLWKVFRTSSLRGWDEQIIHVAVRGIWSHNNAGYETVCPHQIKVNFRTTIRGTFSPGKTSLN